MTPINSAINILLCRCHLVTLSMILDTLTLCGGYTMKKTKLRLLYFAEQVVIRMIHIVSNIDNKYNKHTFKRMIQDLYWWQMITGDAARELEADNEKD